MAARNQQFFGSAFGPNAAGTPYSPYPAGTDPTQPYTSEQSGETRTLIEWADGYELTANPDNTVEARTKFSSGIPPMTLRPVVGPPKQFRASESTKIFGSDMKTFQAMEAPGTGAIKSLLYYRDHGMARQGTSTNPYSWSKSAANGCDVSPCLSVEGPGSCVLKEYKIGGAIEWFPASADSAHNPTWAAGKLNGTGNALLLHDYKSNKSGAVSLKPADNWVIEVGIISYYEDNYWMKKNWLPQCSDGGWGCFAGAGITGYGRSSGTGDGSYGQSWEAFKIKLYGNDAGGSNDYLSIDIDSAISGIDKFRYKTQGSMEGQNTRIGNTGSRGGRDADGSPYNGAVAVIFLGAEYIKSGCKDANANNTCSDCTTPNPSDCRYDNTTVTSFTTSVSSGVVGNTVRLNWVIDSPLLQTATITKSNGGTTDKTFPLNVKSQGNSGFIMVRLDDAGSYRFKLEVTGPGNKSGSKYTSYISIVEPSPDEVLGCTDSSATNYLPAATTDNGSCIKPGCVDSTATNYNSDATTDDGSCEYAETGGGSTGGTGGTGGTPAVTTPPPAGTAVVVAQQDLPESSMLQQHGIAIGIGAVVVVGLLGFMTTR